LVSQFLPLAAFTPGQFAAVVATFLNTFQTSVLWYNTSELLLIGTNASRFAIPTDRLALLQQPGPIRDDLKYSHWGDSRQPLNDPEVFLSGLLLGPDELAELARGAPIYRDDRPVLDYTATRLSFSELAKHPMLSRIEELLTPLDRWLPGFSPKRLARIESIRRRNLGNIRVASAIARANAANENGNPNNVIGILEPLLPLNPRNFLARRMLGQAYAKLEQYDLAARELTIALEIRPDDAQARRGLARAYQKQGKRAAAIEQYRKELAYRPSSPLIHTELATLLYAEGDHEGSQHHLELAVELTEAAAKAASNAPQKNRSGAD